jgi:DNA (cytosine-5)-methyltransferase 1
MDDTADDSKDGCALSVGSLFSGIGGLDLGFERAGFEIAWQCEKDSYCQKVLNKHWPNRPCYDNIKDLHRADGPEPDADILIGGFPCQDISLAGEGAGLDGERSGLWWEYCRLIRSIRPRYAVVENVPALVRRGLRAVLGALAESGYDAEWQIVSAAAMGAPHIRERLFLVAIRAGDVADSEGQRREVPHPFNDGTPNRKSDPSWDGGDVLADPTSERRNPEGCTSQAIFESGPVQRSARRSRSCGGKQWTTEPGMGRLADGVPDRVDRIRGLGNAVVPQVAEFVAECVREHAARTRDAQLEK